MVVLKIRPSLYRHNHILAVPTCNQVWLEPAEERRKIRTSRSKDNVVPILPILLRDLFQFLKPVFHSGHPKGYACSGAASICTCRNTLPRENASKSTSGAPLT